MQEFPWVHWSSWIHLKIEWSWRTSIRTFQLKECWIPAQRFSVAAPASAAQEPPPGCSGAEQPRTLGLPLAPGRKILETGCDMSDDDFHLSGWCCWWRSRSLPCPDQPPLLLDHLRPHVLREGSQETGVNTLGDVKITKDCREVRLSAWSATRCCCLWCRWKGFSWHCTSRRRVLCITGGGKSSHRSCS